MINQIQINVEKVIGEIIFHNIVDEVAGNMYLHERYVSSSYIFRLNINSVT